MKVKFCGAAESVTGSCHLITTEKYKILIDCGQFQGNKRMEAMNYEEFPFNPAEIDAMILSHAHVDHCGRIPLLVKRGFHGKIYCTDATADLVEVMLKDSGYIHEKEAEWQNRKNQRAGKPLVAPLYTLNDAVDALNFLEPVLYDQLVDINDDIKVVFNDAGHILGSAIVELFISENENVSKLVFSGDLGVMDRPILRNPTIIKKADYVIMETTYGNRLHDENDTSVTELLNIIERTIKRGGNVVIPSFAVGRTQELIYQLNKIYDGNLEKYKELKKSPVIIDSPMATLATEIFKKNAQVYDEETREYLMSGDNPLDFEGLKFTKTSDESRAINFDPNPKIIISASGMCEAGRIRHHLKHNLWNKKSSIVFVGYQAEGTLGRALIEGIDKVTLFGEEIVVKAEIYNLNGFSGHADQNGLLEWLGAFQKRPKQVFLVHGERDAKYDFAKVAKERLDYDCTVIEGISEYEFEKVTPISKKEIFEEHMDQDAYFDLRKLMFEINNKMQDVLYQTEIATTKETDAKRLSQINNALLEIEKNYLNLASIVTAEESR